MSNFIVVQEQYSSGTNAASGTANSFNQRALNTQISNTIPGASLGSNVVTLPAGTYRATARAVSYEYYASQLEIYDFGNISSLILSLSACSASGPTAQASLTSIAGPFEFTLASSSTIGINHYVGSAATGSASLGNAVSSGAGEVYSELSIEKI